jgi:hypothetical protein
MCLHDFQKYFDERIWHLDDVFFILEERIEIKFFLE